MDALTKREMQVAELIAWGAQRKTLPELLQKKYGGKITSIHTVNNIVANIYAKLSLNSETELSAWYFCTYHGVDSSKSPLRDIKLKVYSFIFLLVILPQVANIDQAVRPSRSVARVARARTSRTRKSNDNEININGMEGGL